MGGGYTKNEFKAKKKSLKAEVDKSNNAGSGLEMKVALLRGRLKQLGSNRENI